MAHIPNSGRRSPTNGGFGKNTITTHNHNGHNPAESDGFAGAFYFPGQFYDYRWPIALAGHDTVNTAATDPRAGGPDDSGGIVKIPGDWHETMSTHWLHDHMIDFTSQNVYKGNAAMMNLYSSLDRGNEEIKDGVNLRLPSGTAKSWGNLDYDVNLVIADKAWDRDDARARKPGLLEAADGGTLFLDELAELELGVQAKLLKLLEEKTARRLGSLRDYRVNVRIIAATNRSLEERVREGRFRDDLYFRLRIVELHVPPLRQREGDVVVLAHHFLRLHGARYGKRKLAFSREVEAMFRAHRWPGNVRELRNVIEQAVLLAGGTLIQPADLSLCTALASPAASGPEDAGRAGSMPLPSEGVKLSEIERDLLLKALRQTSWNVSQAAKLLGISRETLRHRIEKFSLMPAQ